MPKGTNTETISHPKGIYWPMASSRICQLLLLRVCMPCFDTHLFSFKNVIDFFLLFLNTICPSCLSVAMPKHWPKAMWGESTYFAMRFQIIIKGGQAGTQDGYWEKGNEVETMGTTMYWHFLHCSLSYFSSFLLKFIYLLNHFVSLLLSPPSPLHTIFHPVFYLSPLRG